MRDKKHYVILLHAIDPLGDRIVIPLVVDPGMTIEGVLELTNSRVTTLPVTRIELRVDDPELDGENINETTH